MRATDIAIHSGGIGQSLQGAWRDYSEGVQRFLLSKSPTIEDVNFKLQEQASRIGANAVINVEYSRGMSLLSYEVLKATGTAVVAESDEGPCPFCAETIERAAKKCKHCGSDVTAA